jgi:hypothetical protein
VTHPQQPTPQTCLADQITFGARSANASNAQPHNHRMACLTCPSAAIAWCNKSFAAEENGPLIDAGR